MATSKREKDKKRARMMNAKERAKRHEEAGEFKPTAWKLPDGYERFKWKDGKNACDVMSYLVKDEDEHNPLADPGTLAWERTYHAHMGVGIYNRSYCCLQKMWNEPCPVCEHQAMLIKNGENKEVFKEFYPKERQLIIIHAGNQRDRKGIYECANTRGFGNFRGFGEMVDLKLESVDDGDVIANFADPEEGMSLMVLGKEQHYRGKSYISPQNIEFRPRKEQYEYGIVEEVPNLDELIIKPDYDELKKIFEQAPGTKDDEDEEDEDKEEKEDEEPEEDDEDEEEEEDDEDKPKKKGKKEPTADELKLKKGDYVTLKKDKNEVEYEIKKISGDGTSLTLEDDEGNIKTAVGPEEVSKIKVKDDEEPEEDDDDEPIEDDEDSEDDEEEEESDEDEKEDDEKEEEEDSEDDDEDTESDEEEEEDEDKPKKKTTTTKKPVAKKEAKKPVKKIK